MCPEESSFNQDNTEQYILNSKSTVRWGVVGPGNIAAKFAASVSDVSNASITGVASTKTGQAAQFIDRHKLESAAVFDSYQALFESNTVDAVYIANLHPWHAQTAIQAMRCGKHVLCEKPASTHVSQLSAMSDVAFQENVLFMEAFMYLCHPQMAIVQQLIEQGEIGVVSHIKANFGFNAPIDDQSRLFSHKLGGGGILDVGCYPVSFARRIAGISEGKAFDNPVEVKGVGQLHTTGIDLRAYAVLKFASGVSAECSCAITQSMENRAQIIGDKGHITLLDPWLPGGGNKPAPAKIEVVTENVSRTIDVDCKNHHYAGQLEVACSAIVNAANDASSSTSTNCRVEASYPAMSVMDSLGNASVLDEWRANLGYEVEHEDVRKNTALHGVLPSGLPVMPRLTLPGLDSPISTLVLGCDHHANIAEGSIVWDAWMEAGGNTFDTAFVYANGINEKAFGNWVKSRGVAKDIVVLVKGAHTPYCFPEAIESQLDTSLSRLSIDKAPIYILHRDNTELPVSGFVDTINQLQAAGKIGVYGCSNWSVTRFLEATNYAIENGLNPPSLLNNNGSLAKMTVPVWDGCIAINDESSLQALALNQIPHFSWSAQARGFFAAKSQRHELPKQVGPDRSYAGEDNIVRRERASLLAKERGVSTSNVALAWVLCQAFPSVAIVGPRSVGEIATMLPALSVELSKQEVQWLNLVTDEKTEA